MKTTIDNTQRVFLVYVPGSAPANTVFCNLHDIPNVLTRHPAVIGTTIRHYWNGKLQKCSKQYLNEMFSANDIDFKL